MDTWTHGHTQTGPMSTHPDAPRRPTHHTPQPTNVARMATPPKRALRIDDETWAALQALAATEERSTATYVRFVLKAHVAQRRLTDTNLTTPTQETPNP